MSLKQRLCLPWILCYAILGKYNLWPQKTYLNGVGSRNFKKEMLTGIQAVVLSMLYASVL